MFTYLRNLQNADLGLPLDQQVWIQEPTEIYWSYTFEDKFCSSTDQPINRSAKRPDLGFLYLVRLRILKIVRIFVHQVFYIKTDWAINGVHAAKKARDNQGNEYCAWIQTSMKISRHNCRMSQHRLRTRPHQFLCPFHDTLHISGRENLGKIGPCLPAFSI